jgi:hypothetical protein
MKDGIEIKLKFAIVIYSKVLSQKFPGGKERNKTFSLKSICLDRNLPNAKAETLAFNTATLHTGAHRTAIIWFMTVLNDSKAQDLNQK